MSDHEGPDGHAGGQERFDVEPDDSIVAAAAAVIGRNERRLRRHADRIADSDDPDDVHDARVAARRIRSAFDIFGAELPRKEVRGFRRELRRAGHALATVRDLDVLLASLVAYRDPASVDGGSRSGAPARDHLQPLVEAWTAEREAALRDVRDEIASRRFRRSLQDLRDFATDLIAGERRAAARGRDHAHARGEPAIPARIGAASRVLRAYEVVAAFRVDPLTTDVETLHRLRIAGKRLRYTIEAFEDVLPPDAGRLRDEVVALQDEAGKLHDAVVAGRRARQFVVRSLRQGDDTANAMLPVDETAAAVEQFALSRDRDILGLRESLAERLPRVGGPEFMSRLCSMIVTG